METVKTQTRTDTHAQMRAQAQTFTWRSTPLQAYIILGCMFTVYINDVFFCVWFIGCMEVNTGMCKKQLFVSSVLQSIYFRNIKI